MWRLDCSAPLHHICCIAGVSSNPSWTLPALSWCNAANSSYASVWRRRCDMLSSSMNVGSPVSKYAYLLFVRLSKHKHRFIYVAANNLRSKKDENVEIFQRLLLHAEVRWLSNGACLARFCSYFDSCLKFLEKNQRRLIELNADSAYLTELSQKCKWH